MYYVKERLEKKLNELKTKDEKTREKVKLGCKDN